MDRYHPSIEIVGRAFLAESTVYANSGILESWSLPWSSSWIQVSIVDLANSQGREAYCWAEKLGRTQNIRRFRSHVENFVLGPTGSHSKILIGGLAPSDLCFRRVLPLPAAWGWLAVGWEGEDVPSAGGRQWMGTDSRGRTEGSCKDWLWGMGFLCTMVNAEHHWPRDSVLGGVINCQSLSP